MIGDDVAARLPELRAQAESRMSETVEFFTQTDDIDPDTLQPVKVDTVIGTTKGRIRSAARDSRDVELAGQALVVSQVILSVPVGSVRVGPSVLVRVTGSWADPGMVGSRFRTKDFPSQGQVTAWKYALEQVS